MIQNSKTNANDTNDVTGINTIETATATATATVTTAMTVVQVTVMVEKKATNDNDG